MKTSQSILGKVLYAVLFIIIIPAILISWAVFSEGIVSYDVRIKPEVGLLLGILGILFILWGMFALAWYGKGLPMNAYPPRIFVTKGPFKLVKHPIYWGFGLLVVGASIYFGSASGLWLVSPITILGMIALVWGYERIYLLDVFPNEKLETFFALANNTDKRPKYLQRFAAGASFLVVYFVSNYLIVFLVGSKTALFGNTWTFLQDIPNFNLGLFSLIFILIPAIIVKTQKVLRRWTISVYFGMFFTVYLALLWPEIGAQFFSDDLTGKSTVVFILLAVPIVYILLALKAILLEQRKLNFLFIVVALVLSIYQLSVSKASTVHLLVSIGTFLIVSNYLRLWIMLRNLSNKIANSWKEWVFGPIRIINHGFYVGIGAFLGIFIAGWLVGALYAWALLAFSVSVIVFSALWAQIIEGSEKLKRPYGYYGALVGILFASLIVWLMGVNVWVIIGVVSVVMPWVQAIGRLRCLINGCCHGSRTENHDIGIRYFHYRSRVCGVSEMKGEYLHPTQLYAIIWLFLIGFILFKLWTNEFSYPFIFGIYLILTGLGRFVEEAYRGEVQTPFWKGLRLYQWTAIITVILGMVMTVLNVEMISVNREMNWEIFLAAFLGGLITFFAMGVDFPKSNARFSRLV